MKALEHKIEDNIPIPSVRGGGPRTELGFLLNTMTDGQSFKTSANRATIYSLARYYGITVSVRAEEDHLRVWKMADNQSPAKPDGEAGNQLKGEKTDAN